MVRRTVCALLAIGCGSSEPAPPTLEEIAAQKCPKVHQDRLAGDWLLSTGNPKVRMRVLERGGETLLWYVDPSFSNHKLELVGTQRDKDWRFDERPRGKRVMLIDKGGEAPKRIYLEPRLQDCALHVYAGIVEGEKEVMPPKPSEFLAFPDQPGVVFTYAPHDETLFLGAAATDAKKAAKEVEEHGGPFPATDMGTVQVGIWSEESADGDPSCAYTFDAFFDHQPTTDGNALAASEAKDGRRHWTHTFDAPYSGNHTFELFRYRNCDGDARELIAVAGVDAALN